MITKEELVSDAKEQLNDIGELAQEFTNEDGTVSWQATIGDPVYSQDLGSGGFRERISHTVSIVAADEAWTTLLGNETAAGLENGDVHPDLSVEKVVIAKSQGDRRYLVKSVAHARNSGWVTLTVSIESSF